MVEEFPGNSHQAKEAKTKPAQPRSTHKPKKVEQVTRGAVRQRKRPLGKRLKETFFGGDAKGVWGYVTMDVLIPAAKDMIADATTQAVERMVFGESRGRRGRFPGTPGHVRYDGYARSPGSTATPPWRPDAPRREVSQQGRSTHNFNEIILESRGEAEQVIDLLIEMISQYEQATVADLYELVGISSAYTDQKYGWTDLQGANVQHVRGGSYLLNLPRPQPL